MENQKVNIKNKLQLRAAPGRFSEDRLELVRFLAETDLNIYGSISEGTREVARVQAVEIIEATLTTH